MHLKFLVNEPFTFAFAIVYDVLEIWLLFLTVLLISYTFLKDDDRSWRHSTSLIPSNVILYIENYSRITIPSGWYGQLEDVLRRLETNLTCGENNRICGARRNRFFPTTMHLVIELFFSRQLLTNTGMESFRSHQILHLRTSISPPRWKCSVKVTVLTPLSRSIANCFTENDYQAEIQKW